MKNSPKLRFPEFVNSGEWEEKNLIDISDFINQKISLDKLTLNSYISTENLLQDFLGVAISSKLPDVKTVTHFKENDILISNIRPYLKKVWSATFDGGASNDVIVVRAKENTNNNFLTYLLKNEEFINYVMQGAKGVKMPRGDISLIKKYPLFISSNPKEQQKIADCLSSVDSLISAQSKKVELLKEHKKGLMQQLFPQDTEEVPKLRFPEFKNAPKWEEKEVGEIFQVTRGYVLSMSLVTDKQVEKHIYPVYSSQTKNNGLAGYYPEYLYEDAITWTTDGANAGDVNYRKGKFYCTNVCGVLLNNKGYANACIAEIINSVSKNYVSYVGNPKLMNGIMSKIPIKLPSPKEQQKIADCLSSLDEQISQQTTKLQTIKEHKKALMQQLFPNSEVNQ